MHVHPTAHLPQFTPSGRALRAPGVPEPRMGVAYPGWGTVFFHRHPVLGVHHVCAAFRDDSETVKVILVLPRSPREPGSYSPEEYARLERQHVREFELPREAVAAFPALSSVLASAAHAHGFSAVPDGFRPMVVSEVCNLCQTMFEASTDADACAAAHKGLKRILTLVEFPTREFRSKARGSFPQAEEGRVIPASDIEAAMVPSRGDWMQTFTGRRFWPLDPLPEDVVIEDIAHALSLICRYNGHSKEFYSVAEHSVYVSREVPPSQALWGLLHDASEAYIADIVRPAKRGIPGYAEIEERIMGAVCKRFGLDSVMPPGLKVIDDRIISDERTALFDAPAGPWTLREPLGIKIAKLSPKDAEKLFLQRFNELKRSNPQPVFPNGYDDDHCPSGQPVPCGCSETKTEVGQ